MAGRPKTRAKRLAMEAARRAAGGGGLPPQVTTHTIPQPPPAPEIGWVDHVPPAPKPPREEAIDTLVASVMPEGGPAVGLIGTEKEHLYTELVGLSLARALDIMRLQPHHTCSKCGFEEGDPNFDKQILTRQASIVASVLSTTARIDEARLKGGQRDKVKELLDELKRIKPGQAN